MKLNNLFALCLICVCTTCSLAPEYTQPDIEIPDSYSISDVTWNKPHPNDNYNRGDWWVMFGDAQLNSLEEKLNKDNYSIATAAAQHRQSLALVTQARAAFFPIVSANMTDSKQKGSITNQTLQTSATNATRSLSLNASWEPDLWGAVASNVDAVTASSEAIQANLEAIRLSSQASLAQFYFEWCTLSNDDKLLHNLVEANAKTVGYMKYRYSQGVADNADVLQAQINLEEAQAQLVNNTINLDTYKHAIAVLVGMHPSAFTLSSCSYKGTPQNIPLELPSTLLERRPDIAQAERLAAQSNALIGVARAAYFPTVLLSASKSGVGRGLKDLFSFPLSAWSASSSITQSIFNGGAQIAATIAAEEGFNASVASYRQVVLSAFQDVEDNLTTLQHLRTQEVVQKESTKNVGRTLKIVENQYKAGTVDQSVVLASQISYYTSAKATSDLEGLRISSEIGLIKALGGMWYHKPSKEVPGVKCNDEDIN